MLGYASFAEVSLVPKMADNRRPRSSAFLRDLAARPSPSPARHGRTARLRPPTKLGLDDTEAWDMTWASEKLKQARYATSPTTR
jgi:oligopeptidase A